MHESVKLPSPEAVMDYDGTMEERVGAALAVINRLMSNRDYMLEALCLRENQQLAYSIYYPNNPVGFSIGNPRMTDYMADHVVEAMVRNGWVGASYTKHTLTGYYFVLPRLDSPALPTPSKEWTNLMPWDVPPLVVVKVNPAEILGMLRSAVNIGYMPTSTQERQFNSKPTYITGGVEAWLGKRRRHAFDNGSGYYADAEDTATNGIYAALHVGMFIIVVKLRTEECWIRHYTTDAEFHRWIDQPVALDRVELTKVFDDYI